MNPDRDYSSFDAGWRALCLIKEERLHPPGVRLFERGIAAHGIYLIEEGLVNLGSVLEKKADPLFEAAGPGAVLGLAEAVTGEAYRLTAEVIAPSRISYIERTLFLEVMRQQPEFCMQVVRLLSENLHGLYHRFQNAPLRRKSSA